MVSDSLSIFIEIIIIKLIVYHYIREYSEDPGGGVKNAPRPSPGGARVPGGPVPHRTSPSLSACDPRRAATCAVRVYVRTRARQSRRRSPESLRYVSCVRGVCGVGVARERG